VRRALSDPALMLRATEVVVAVGALVMAAELLATRAELHDDGLLSWRLQRLNHPRLARLLGILRVDRLFRYPAVLVLLGIRLVAAPVLITAICLHWPVFPALFALTSTTLLFNLRSPGGNDGSDQMSLIVLVVSTLGEAVGTQAAYSAALVFVAAQSALAYGTSGFLKALENGWRNGDFVKEILATSSFGNRALLRLFTSHAILGRCCGCAVAFGDCFLGIAALLPPVACAWALGFGLILHVGIARILGLNTFLWAFGATYPAILFVSSWIYTRA
jgi:hypothetical protein